MSGPKSARYTLTPEQRRILAEARERERKTIRELDKLQQYRVELASLKERLGDATTSIDMLVDRVGDGNEVQQSIRNSIMQIETIIQESASLSKQSGLGVQFHQKQRNMMQVKPVSCHITHLSFHRLKATVRNQAFYLCRKCMS